MAGLGGVLKSAAPGGLRVGIEGVRHDFLPPFVAEKSRMGAARSRHPSLGKGFAGEEKMKFSGNQGRLIPFIKCGGGDAPPT